MKRLVSAIQHQRAIKVISQSKLFDSDYYIAHCPEVLQSGLSPLEHYVKIGSTAGFKPNAFFDDEFYRDANPDIKESKTNPLVHYIKFGAKEGRNPSRSFNTNYYLEKHPDVAESGVNPLWHFITYGVSEHRETDNARTEALSPQARELYEKLVELEPLLPQFDDLKYVPMERCPSESIAGRAYFKLAALAKNSISHLFVLQRLMHGGAATLSMFYADLVKEKKGADSVMVILADEPNLSAAHLLPEGVTMVALDHLQPGLTEEEKVQVVARFIIEMQPKVVHGVDSNVCWQIFSRYHRQCRPETSLVASLFMFCYNESDRKAGFASDCLNNTIDQLDLVLGDNDAFKQEASTLYALEKHNQDKIAVIYTPIFIKFYEPDPNGAKAKRVLWSSRLHSDKRPDLLAAIARAMPDFEFEVYGASALSEPELAELNSVSNIKLHGPYKSIEELPRDGIGAYLHTTKHEGGAITLKEAAARGLPVIGPAIGLITDMVTPDTGWLVRDVNNVDEYVAAIRDCLSDPDERVRRVKNFQEMLRREHSWESFSSTVSALPAYRLK